MQQIVVNIPKETKPLSFLRPGRLSLFE